MAKHTRNSYAALEKKQLSPEELGHFSPDLLEKIIAAYLEEQPANFIRLRWFLRRLSQVGVAGAVDYCVDHLKEMSPAIGEICHYLTSARENYDGNWEVLGDRIYALLQDPLVRLNDFFPVSLLSLFAGNPALDHAPKLLELYGSYSATVRREVLLSAGYMHQGDWLRERKEAFGDLDPWAQRAFIVASRSLPHDERQHFLRRIGDGTLLTDLLVTWAKA